MHYFVEIPSQARPTMWARAWSTATLDDFYAMMVRLEKETTPHYGPGPIYVATSLQEVFESEYIEDADYSSIEEMVNKEHGLRRALPASYDGNTIVYEACFLASPRYFSSDPGKLEAHLAALRYGLSNLEYCVATKYDVANVFYADSDEAAMRLYERLVNTPANNYEDYLYAAGRLRAIVAEGVPVAPVVDGYSGQELFETEQSLLKEGEMRRPIEGLY